MLFLGSKVAKRTVGRRYDHGGKKSSKQVGIYGS